VLALLVGSVVAMTAGPRAGIAAGLAALAMLAAVRLWEGRPKALARPA